MLDPTFTQNMIKAIAQSMKNQLLKEIILYFLTLPVIKEEIYLILIRNNIEDLNVLCCGTS